ncbi:hypothetical protein [Empedobacter brevis]|uniref:hypothetical protein n=1 Tax=Empedobacter brevis TaxID=247 RepID=UPI0028982D63|nr:hypothetical protein [Empedobacter brevis]
MNLKILFPFLCCAITFSFGQSPSLLDKQLEKDRISSEFTELYQLTTAIHPGQYMYCSEKEFDKTYFELKNSIKNDLSIVDYYKLTATLMAKVKDGHTAVDRGLLTTLLKEKLVFPFRIYQIKNHYYFDHSIKENKEYTGLQILKINGKDIHSVVKNIKKYIHLEGRNETGLNTRFKYFPFYYYLDDQAEKFEVEFIDQQHQKQKVVFNGITFDRFTKSTVENIPPLTTEIRADNIAVLTFHSFENGYNEADRKLEQNKLDLFLQSLTA